MGEKSRGNWLVEWCGLKGKGCEGKCGRCVRKSEATVKSERLGGKRAAGAGRAVGSAWGWGWPG